MKNLVKLFVVVIVFTLTTNGLWAQNFGIKAGLNLSNMLVSDDNDTYSNDFKTKPGFHGLAIKKWRNS